MMMMTLLFLNASLCLLSRRVIDVTHDGGTEFNSGKGVLLFVDYHTIGALMLRQIRNTSFATLSDHLNEKILVYSFYNAPTNIKLI